MKEVVDFTAATKEIETWLDFHKVTPLQKESFKDSIAALVEGIQYGMLTLKDNAFTQTLLFPFGEEEKVAVINYKQRITFFELEDKMKGVAAGDGTGRVIATLAALTGQPKQILKLLDKADKRIANSIVVFFLET